MISNELFVETRLLAAGRVIVGRPVARTIRCEHFVNENQFIGDAALRIKRETKLKLRIGEDDAARAGVLRRGAVNRKRERAQPLHHIAADEFRGAFEGDILVVALFSLRCRRENGLRQATRKLKSRGQWDAADRARRAVLVPTASGEIAARNALDRHNLCGAAEHRAPCKHRLVVRSEPCDRRKIRTNHVITDDLQLA